MEAMNRIAQARKDAGMSARELAEKLGVDATTISNWEAGRRQLTLEKLIQTAKVLNVSVTYLLGIDERVNYLKPIETATLPMLHYTPVWTVSRGWALVNSVKRVLIFTDKSDVPFEMVQEPIYAVPPVFALSLRGMGAPLCMDALLSYNKIWVEPITTDSTLATELRGWYHPHGQRLVESEFGHRFYIDTYGAKWLAFANCMNDG